MPETPSNARGIFGKEAQEVVYVYDRSDAAPVTVKYEDTKGNQLSEPTILSGKLGCHMKANQKKFQAGMCQKRQAMLMEFLAKSTGSALCLRSLRCGTCNRQV